jgi:hypothetical protein
MDNADYHHLYRKYKSKYLRLLSMMGGGGETETDLVTSETVPNRILRHFKVAGQILEVAIKGADLWRNATNIWDHPRMSHTPPEWFGLNPSVVDTSDRTLEALSKSPESKQQVFSEVATRNDKWFTAMESEVQVLLGQLTEAVTDREFEKAYDLSNFLTTITFDAFGAVATESRPFSQTWSDAIANIEEIVGAHIPPPPVANRIKENLSS